MKIKSKIKDYSFEIVDDIFSAKEDISSKLQYNKLLYLIDENVYKIYDKKIKEIVGDDFCLVIPAEEDNKSYLKLADYYRSLIDAGIRRNDVLVTMGGGILQDISGFIASTLYRGLRWVFFPTTLLAQADSCIGSKTSINFDSSKNLIGTFYPPDLIYTYLLFCETLTASYFNSGMGEIIKFHLMSDGKGYALLKEYLTAGNLRNNKYFKAIIASTLEIKRSYFENDEFDAGRRNLLNYGHCFGHALESASLFNISHGEAVIIGMGFANLLSLNRGRMSQSKYEEFELIFRPFYPKIDWVRVGIEDLLYYLKRDKKRVGNDLTMILSEDIGKQFKLNDIKEPEIREAYDEFLKNYPAI